MQVQSILDEVEDWGEKTGQFLITVALWSTHVVPSYCKTEYCDDCY